MQNPGYGGGVASLAANAQGSPKMQRARKGRSLE